MKKLPIAVAFVSASLLPALALACPAASAAGCCGGAFMEYANGFGGGLLVGILSVVAESAWRRRRGGSA